jgi:hypothetical protein
MARKFDYEDLPADASAEDVLEIDVNRSVVGYDALAGLCRLTLVNNRPFVIGGEAAEVMLRNVVFYSDARARIRNAQTDTAEHLLWVKEAQEGIERMAEFYPQMSGLEDSRLFKTDPLFQKIVYHEMCKYRSFTPGTILANPDVSYSDRVASREIVLSAVPQISLT